MKIFLDSPTKHIMIQRMEPIWNEMGCEISPTSEGCDIQLCLIKKITETDLPIVLRLDGVYYDLGLDYKKLNEPISKTHSEADMVIYQSEYGKKMCAEYLTKRKGKSTIIYNGIAPGWCGEKEKHEGYNIVVPAIWRRFKRLKEITGLFSSFWEIHQGCKLHVIGNIHESTISHPDIKYYGKLDYNQMKEVYRIADLHIHLAKRDNCPNTVVEAIGAGVSVLTTNICGGGTEMCQIYQGGFVVNEGEISYSLQDVYSEEYSKLDKDIIDKLLERMDFLYHTRLRYKPSVCLGIRHTAEKYIHAMKEIL